MNRRETWGEVLPSLHPGPDPGSRGEALRFIQRLGNLPKATI
jgi:hypothetical protein